MVFASRLPLGLRLLLGGITFTFVGIWWFVDGLLNGVMNEIIGGLVWKGPLLALAGVSAACYGYSKLTARSRRDPDRPSGSVRQLVGSMCSWCRRPIRSTLEGKLCDGCGNAVHHRCIKPQATLTSAGRCYTCGVLLSDAEVLRDRQGQSQPVARGPYLVSKVCPSCGCAEFKRLRPERLLAFASDRICVVCQMRYTPPTPLWGALVFILVGLLLAGFGLVGLTTRLVVIAANGNLLALPAMAFEGFIGFLGILALVQGLRALIKRRKS
jgi:hypothetical protein